MDQASLIQKQPKPTMPPPSPTTTRKAYVRKDPKPIIQALIKELSSMHELASALFQELDSCTLGRKYEWLEPTWGIGSSANIPPTTPSGNQATGPGAAMPTSQSDGDASMIPFRKLNDVVQDVINKGKYIYELMPRVEEFQKLQYVIKALVVIRDELQMKIHHVMFRLVSAESKLRDEMEVAKKFLQASEIETETETETNGENAMVTLGVSDLVNYAARVRGCLGAPPNWDVNRPMPAGYLPPAPTEQMMRMGKLAQYSDLKSFTNTLLEQSAKLTASKKKELGLDSSDDDADMDSADLVASNEAFAVVPGGTNSKKRARADDMDQVLGRPTKKANVDEKSSSSDEDDDDDDGVEWK